MIDSTFPIQVLSWERIKLQFSPGKEYGRLLPSLGLSDVKENRDARGQSPYQFRGDEIRSH